MIKKLNGRKAGNTIYDKEINSYPVLSREEERELIAKAQGGDDKACETLVKHNLRLVRKIAYQIALKKHLTREEREDAVQLGNIGLMRAVTTFDLSRNSAFSTHATSYVMRDILRELSVNLNRDAHILPAYLSYIESHMDFYRKSFVRKKKGPFSEESFWKYLKKETGRLKLPFGFVLSQGNPALVHLEDKVDPAYFGDQITTLGETLEDDNFNPEKIALANELSEFIMCGLNKLHEKEATALRLHHFIFEKDKKYQGLTPEQIYQIAKKQPKFQNRLTFENIGKLMGVSHETARKYAINGRNRLKGFLGTYLNQ